MCVCVWERTRVVIEKRNLIIWTPHNRHREGLICFISQLFCASGNGPSVCQLLVTRLLCPPWLRRPVCQSSHRRSSLWSPSGLAVLLSRASESSRYVFCLVPRPFLPFFSPLTRLFVRLKRTDTFEWQQ